MALRTIAIEPLAFGASLESFYESVAKAAPRGAYPRAIAGEQSYWTVVGVDGDDAEALIDEDGGIEVGKASFSIEPLLAIAGKRIAWSDVTSEPSLEGGALPIPSVRWRHRDLELTVMAFATGEVGRSSLVARYRVRNRTALAQRVTLYLAIRPFQVNPPAQFLNTPGGVAPIRRIESTGGLVRVDERVVIPLVAPSGFGAATFDQGDVVADFLRRDRLGSSSSTSVLPMPTVQSSWKAPWLRKAPR